MPAQVHGPHPEALERQPEQGQQGDLEDAVVADEDRPRMRRGRIAVAGHLRSIERAGRAAVAPGREQDRRRGPVRRAPRPRPGSRRRARPSPTAGVARPPGCRRSARRSRPRSGPSQSPWPISRNPGSPRSGTGAAPARTPPIASAIASAVAAVRSSGEWTISPGRLAGTGRAGGTRRPARRFGDRERPGRGRPRSAASPSGPGIGPPR